MKGVIPAEGKFDVQWHEQLVTLADGEQVALRAPTLTISELAYGPLGADAMTGLRLAPPLIGLGLLEAIPEETIVQLAARAPVAGIRGRVNRVWDESQGKTVLGRFGLKANHGSLREQVAAAFINDIGLSTPVYPEQNCPAIQSGCKEQMVAGKPEITPLRLAATELYIRALMVPVRRQTEDAQVRRGEQLFVDAHCAVCHVPELKTGEFRAHAAACRANHPALHRPAAARHGRGARRRAPGLPGRRQRVAHARRYGESACRRR